MIKAEEQQYCAVDGCNKLCKPGHVMCFDHWFRLPLFIRRLIGKHKINQSTPEWDAVQMLAKSYLQLLDGDITEQEFNRVRGSTMATLKRGQLFGVR